MQRLKLPARAEREPRCGGSRCLVRRAEYGWDAQLRCLHTTLAPACQRILIDPSAQHSAITQCRSDYVPFAARRFPDVLDRSMPSTIGAGMGLSPEVWRESAVRLETFAPQTYFRRSITIPAIRLNDQLRAYDRSAAN